jgi:hypothetical protein
MNPGLRNNHIIIQCCVGKRGPERFVVVGVKQQQLRKINTEGTETSTEGTEKIQWRPTSAACGMAPLGF